MQPKSYPRCAIFRILSNHGRLDNKHRDCGPMSIKASKGSVKRIEKPAETGFRALIRVADLLSRVMQPYFSRYGISGSRWGVLRALDRAEREGLSGLRMMDLGDRLLVRPPSVTGLLDRLQRIGYIVRHTSPTDRRGKEVRLTRSGRDLIKQILKGHAKQIEAVMQGLGAVDRKKLCLLLKRLEVHLESMLVTPGTSHRQAD